jgi:tetratricopeptide (TPR) repeat protein
MVQKVCLGKEQNTVITREIAVNIAECLNIKLSEAELRMISTESSPNVDANLNFIAAKVISDDAWFYYNYGDKMVDSTDFISAVRTYGKAIEFDSMFAQAYARRAIAISWGFYTGQLDSSYISRCRDDIDKALSINKDLYDASIALGFYFYYCKNDLKNAIIYFREAANKKPDEYHPLFYLALVYRRMGEWEASQKLIHKVIKYNPKEALFLTNIGLSYSFIHKFDSALIFHDQAIECMPNWWPPYSNKFNTLILKDGKPDQARAVIDTAIIKTGKEWPDIKSWPTSTLEITWRLYIMLRTLRM